MTTIAGTGTVASSSGTTYISGRSSGLDTEALVEAAVQARLAPADRIDAQVNENETKIKAYQDLQGLLLDLQDTSQALRNPPGYFGAEDNVFERYAAYSTSSGTRPAGELMGVSVGSGVQSGSHDVEVLQLAEAHKISSADQPDRSAPLGLSGSFSIGTASTGTATVTMTPDMSLDGLRDAINAQSASSGVTASILQVSPTASRLILTANETGEAISTSFLAGDDVLQSLGVTDATGSHANVLQAPQEAILRVDGVEVRRPTNSIDDVIDGVTLDLYAAEPGTTVRLDVENDLGAIKQAVIDFVAAYNAYRDFVLGQQAVDASGQPAPDAVLFGDGLLRSVSADVSSNLIRPLSSGSLADVGLKFDEGNRLVLDEGKLDSALVTDLAAVREIFEFQMQSTSSDLRVLSTSNSVSATNFTVNVTTDASGALIGADIDGDPTAVTVDGSRIIGAAGTPYEGLVLAYGGTNSASIGVSISQGIADRLYNSIDALANPLNGQITQAIQGAEDDNGRLQDRSARIRDGAEGYRQRLVDRYAKMEAEIAQANLLRDQLKALLDSDDE